MAPLSTHPKAVRSREWRVAHPDYNKTKQREYTQRMEDDVERLLGLALYLERGKH